MGANERHDLTRMLCDAAADASGERRTHLLGCLREFVTTGRFAVTGGWDSASPAPSTGAQAPIAP